MATSLGVVYRLRHFFVSEPHCEQICNKQYGDYINGCPNLLIGKGMAKEITAFMQAIPINNAADNKIVPRKYVTIFHLLLQIQLFIAMENDITHPVISKYTIMIYVIKIMYPFWIGSFSLIS